VADPDVVVKKMTAWAPTPVDEDGTPLYHGERMVEIRPGEWVTPPLAAALALLAEVDRG